ncbi:MAG TPA: DUF362 domain-containing protein [Candidatus Acidoferrum sp.]|jgi:uncharacterized protein (DUF362 family)
MPPTITTSPADQTPVSRRDAMLRILRLSGIAVATAATALYLSERSQHPLDDLVTNAKHDHTIPPLATLPSLAVITNGTPEQLVQRALQELGGINRFISRNDVVIIKPNIAWDRTPEQAANTNPQVVAELIRQCWNAGAKKVIVTDVSCNDPRRCFQRSGIADAAAHEGAQVLLPDSSKFKQVDLSGEVLQAWPVFQPFLEADKIINVPIAKHHSLTGVTLGMKNWYGILGGQRQQLHQHIHESLVDLADFMRPTLTVIDSYRILLRNGPTGGNLEDVQLKKSLIAGTDPVALDAYVAKAFWNLDASAMPYLAQAHSRHLGTPDFASLSTKLVNLS